MNTAPFHFILIKLHVDTLDHLKRLAKLRQQHAKQ
jgi:hypothetical protein